MSSSVEQISDRARSRRRRLGLFALSGVVVLSAVVAARLNRRIVFVGREWPARQRSAIGDVSHQIWDELLREYVDAAGNVDYAGWKESASGRMRLDEYLNRLSQADESREATASQRLSFWINGYNAVTVGGILREYPTASIQNHVARVWGYNIWRDLQLIVGGGRVSLGEIEHDRLRRLNEPRIHFAVVCASRGCPRLLNEAYLADRLDEQLSRNTAAFFADPGKCSIDVERRELWLSPILNWYAADFGSSPAEQLRRLAPWLPDGESTPSLARRVSARSLAESGDVRVRYLDYDWTLNDQATARPPLPPLP